MTASASGRLPHVLSWAALAFVVAGSAAILALIYLVSPHLSGEALRGYAVVVFGLANVSFGALLVRRVPRNAIGWLLMTAAVVLTITEVSTFYGAYALLVNPAFPGGVVAAWLDLDRLAGSRHHGHAHGSVVPRRPCPRHGGGSWPLSRLSLSPSSPSPARLPLSPITAVPYGSMRSAAS